ARDVSLGRVATCVVLPDAAPAGAGDTMTLPVYRDHRGEFARQYAARGRTAFLVRPDGYLSARLQPPTAGELASRLALVFQV
ncbi:pentachlorophenol monooxygenase, partial [Streptomyces goshikiensis]